MMVLDFPKLFNLQMADTKILLKKHFFGLGVHFLAGCTDKSDNKEVFIVSQVKKCNTNTQ